MDSRLGLRSKLLLIGFWAAAHEPWQYANRPRLRDPGFTWLDILFDQNAFGRTEKYAENRSPSTDHEFLRVPG